MLVRLRVLIGARVKGKKRPADAISKAIMVAKIATGEIENITTVDGKNAAAVALGAHGWEGESDVIEEAIGYC